VYGRVPGPRQRCLGSEIALAYWLVRVGSKVTVIERAPSLRRDGQGIDVRDAARDVIMRMGIFDRIRDKSSHKKAYNLLTKPNRYFAS